MKTRLKLIALTGALALGAALILTNDRAAAMQDEGRERDEINETYRLAPGADVQVESISGSVTIETADTDTAQVQIVRSARTREELACRPVQIEHTDARLVIDGNDHERRCRNARVRQDVRLRLPRRVRLSVESVSGHVTAGDLEGPANFTSISGHATVGNVRGPVSFTSISGNVRVTSALDAARFTSISGRVEITLTRLGAQGLHANSISGNVDVGISDEVNADLRIESISGDVISDGGPRITVTRVRADEFSGRIGAGGPPMEFTSISGNIRLHRAGV